MITFRKADISDTERIAEIYNRIHDLEEEGVITIGWNREIYPTLETAVESVNKGDMFVCEDDGIIVAAAKINKEQVYPAYDEADWMYESEPSNVMVIHTLVVDPLLARQGYGKAFINYYEAFAADAGCSCLRLDTNERNSRARNLYRSLGYREASIVPCIFNGIPSVNLVCIEKLLGDN